MLLWICKMFCLLRLNSGLFDWHETFLFHYWWFILFSYLTPKSCYIVPTCYLHFIITLVCSCFFSLQFSVSKTLTFFSRVYNINLVNQVLFFFLLYSLFFWTARPSSSSELICERSQHFYTRYFFPPIFLSAILNFWHFLSLQKSLKKKPQTQKDEKPFFECLLVSL